MLIKVQSYIEMKFESKNNFEFFLCFFLVLLPLTL